VTSQLPQIKLKPPGRLPDELLDSTLYLLGRLGFAIKSRVMEEFEREECSMWEYSVLAMLDEKARETQAAIADALQVDRSQLVGVLDGLEARGLVERRRDPNDRRRHLVTLTPEGKRQLVHLRAIVKRVEESFLAPLDEASRAVLHESLLKVAGAYDDRFERRPPTV
jgi:MarR family transcriptional regulator, lower aerobic nicotinate degradation pathway regulator